MDLTRQKPPRAEFLGRPRGVGGKRLLEFAQRLHRPAKRLRRGDAFLRRRHLLERETRDAMQLKPDALTHDAEGFSNPSRLAVFQIAGRANASRCEAKGEPFADAPDVLAGNAGEQFIHVPHGFQIQHAAEFGRFFGKAVGHLGQRLGRPDADGNRNPGPLPHARPQLPRKLHTLRVLERQKRLVNRVNLHRRHERAERFHHPRRHVAVERVVGTHHHHAVLFKGRLVLVRRGAHRHAESLHLLAARDHAAVVVAQNRQRTTDQAWIKNALAGRVEIIAVDQREPGFHRG